MFLVTMIVAAVMMGLAFAGVAIAVLERRGFLAGAAAAAAVIARRQPRGQVTPGPLALKPPSARGYMRSYRVVVELGTFREVVELRAYDREEALERARARFGIARVRLLEGAFVEHAHPAVAA